MKSVKQIIDVLGGFDRLRRAPIRLEVASFLPLCIAYLGKGPRGGLRLSLRHVFEQHGDLMRDPDLEVEVVVPLGPWLPLSIRMDPLGLFREAVTGEGDGLVVHSRLVEDLTDFMATWDQNLAAQGFVEAARRLAQKGGNG